MGKNNGSCSCGNKNSDANSPASCFFSLPPAQFSLLSSVLGILFLNNLDASQQNSLGNFIVGVGQTILTAAAQSQTVQSSNQQNDRMHQQINMLKKQICALEDELNRRG